MVERIPIETDRVELGAFLKWARVADTGGRAKGLIRAGRVKVNGQVERRRGRMLTGGDRVEVSTRVLEVVRS